MNARSDALHAIRQHIEEKWPASAKDAGEQPAGPWLKPYAYRDPTTLARREWLYGGHYIRSFTSATFAPGGVGKSVLCMTEAVAMALGRPVLGIQPTGRYRVAYWNGEDPVEEIERRLGALHIEYDITPGELDGRFFMGSGREHGLTIAEQTPDGTRICKPDVDKVKDCIRDLGLDVLVIDPFVSSHRVPENDNNAVDAVAKAWGKIADECNVSIELSHHTVKHSGRETRVEDGRGGGALLFAVRSARVLNVMTDEEAEAAGIANPLAYFRVNNGKANLMPRTKSGNWYRFVGVDLGNAGPDGEPGDNVGVVRTWEWPQGVEAVGKPQKLGAAAQAIWTAYVRLRDEGQTMGPPNVPGVQSGAKAVHDGHLKQVAVKLRLVADPQPDKAEAKDEHDKWLGTVRKAWTRGTGQLTEQGIMRFEAGFGWALPGAERKAGFARVTSRDESKD